MHSERSTRSVICVHEDRAHCITGIKLSILSLRAQCAKIPIVVSVPTAASDFVEWLGHIPDTTLVVYPETRNCAWNVKPTVLLRLLEGGYSDVIWVDSDIIVCRDVLTPLTEKSPKTFGGTEETYWGQNQGGIARTVAWGLDPGREMPCTINSGVLRVTPEHVGLLKAWQLMLQHPIYARAQALPWYDRPLHMITDQEALTALLGSQPYASIPMALLRRGVDIAQCMGPGGFTPWERVRALRSGLPGLIHSMGIKPWTKEAMPPRLQLNLQTWRKYYDYLHMELTPYVSTARKYGPALKEDISWMKLKSKTARVMTAIAAHSPILQEFPLSLVDAEVRRWRRWRKIARYHLHDEFMLRESPLL
jgi:hypothetical protein